MLDVGCRSCVQEDVVEFNRSKGIAVVNFQRSGDGNKAYQQYNNRLIDGS